MAIIGNIGAHPVVDAEGLPPQMRRAGMKFAVRESNQVFGIYEVQGGQLQRGMGGFWSSLIRIGGIVAAPFTGGASLFVTAGSQIGAGLVAGKEAKGAQEKEIAKQWDALAAQVTQLFNSIQSKPNVTAQDVSQAEAALTQLAQAAEQFKTITYISEHWNSDAYRPAYETRLSQIRAAAGGAASGAVSASAGDSSSDSSTLLIVLAVVAGLWILKG